MDNVGRILKDRHISVNGLLALIHDRHPDCGLPYSILRRLVSHERKMSIDEAILICDALDIPFTALPRISTGPATPPEPGIRLEIMRIHRHLFDGVFTDDWVGRWRRVNLIKKEPVLRGDSVPYAPFLLIGEMLDYEYVD